MARIVLAGASGLIGRALTAALRREGMEVRRLVRRPPAGPEEVRWDPAAGALDPAALDGVGAVVNLAGRPLTSAGWDPRGFVRDRWTAPVRREILDSRTGATRLIVGAIGRAARPPALISASAIGYYGDRGDQILTETAPAGSGFLAGVTQAWEAEALRARAQGARVVCLRFGLVLDRRGGALARLLPVFRLGLGGPLGSGRQWWSWVHLDDVMGALLQAIRAPALSGPVNVVAPEPVTNRAFAQVLGAVLRRPAVLPVPAVALRLALGAMADEMLLASLRVAPARLQEAGYAFRFTALRGALEEIVGRRS